MKIFLKSVLFTGVALLALSPLASLHAQGKPGWSEDPKQALVRAKAEKKLVLLDFTGSDWCSACLHLDKDVFSTPEFQRFAGDNLVLVELDFPEEKPQAPATKRQNEAWRSRYGVEGFPTLIVLDAEGKTLRTFEGYPEGGAKAFIAELKKLRG